MRMLVVSVRDAKAEIYMRPWFVQTAGVAIRSFMDEVNREDKDNQLFNHPSDFALYQIGEYDDNEGKVYGYEVPRLLLQADQVRSSRKHEVLKNLSVV